MTQLKTLLMTVTVLALATAATPAFAASQWVPIADWSQCFQMSQPGYVFELENAEGQTMLSTCEQAVPARPFDWKSDAVQFRAVSAPPSRHSAEAPVSFPEF